MCRSDESELRVEAEADEAAVAEEAEGGVSGGEWWVM